MWNMVIITASLDLQLDGTQKVFERKSLESNGNLY